MGSNQRGRWLRDGPPSEEYMMSVYEPKIAGTLGHSL